MVGTANALRDYSRRKIFDQTASLPTASSPTRRSWCFAGSDDQKRTILLVLSGVAASACSEDKKEPRPPPWTLELSYIEDVAHSDIFKIGGSVLIEWPGDRMLDHIAEEPLKTKRPTKT